MDALTSAAASGMRARMESLEMLGNNIANASSSGFKADREFYGLYVSPEAADSQSGTATTELPVMERQWTDFSQGSLTPTGNPLNVALTGEGFFTVSSSNAVLYTRDGDFRLDPSGQLETQQGYAVLDSSGKPVHLNPAKPSDVSPDGTIRQDGQVAAKLGVVRFTDANALAKRGGLYFQANAQLKPEASSARVEQGALESANVPPAEVAVRLVGVMRQFEMLQRALSLGNDMNRQAIEEVAKVS
ncbi:MAG: flagellar basal-body rod protein FlgF [Bryobacteraceae bacterium]